MYMRGRRYKNSNIMLERDDVRYSSGSERVVNPLAFSNEKDDDEKRVTVIDDEKN